MLYSPAPWPLTNTEGVETEVFPLDIDVIIELFTALFAVIEFRTSCLAKRLLSSVALLRLREPERKVKQSCIASWYKSLQSSVKFPFATRSSTRSLNEFTCIANSCSVIGAGRTLLSSANAEWRWFASFDDVLLGSDITARCCNGCCGVREGGVSEMASSTTDTVVFEDFLRGLEPSLTLLSSRAAIAITLFRRCGGK